MSNPFSIAIACISASLSPGRPKIFVGFSDISVLLSVLERKAGLVTFHGPMVTTLADADDATVACLAEALTVAEPLHLPTDMTQDRLRDSFGTPSAVAFWNLPAYIRGLEKAGFSARSYQVWFQMEMATPLLLSAMVLIAAGFTMRHARFGKTGSMVLLALMGGFLIFFLRNFAQVLGENGQIPVLVAAWSPPLGAVLMALGLLLHLEDG